MATDPESDPERQRQAMAAMFAHLTTLLPPAGQPLSPERRRKFLTVIERALDYLYDPPAPNGEGVSDAADR